MSTTQQWWNEHEIDLQRWEHTDLAQCGRMKLNGMADALEDFVGVVWADLGMVRRAEEVYSKVCAELNNRHA